MWRYETRRLEGNCTESQSYLLMVLFVQNLLKQRMTAIAVGQSGNQMQMWWEAGVTWEERAHLASCLVLPHPHPQLCRFGQVTELFWNKFPHQSDDQWRTGIWSLKLFPVLAFHDFIELRNLCIILYFILLLSIDLSLSLPPKPSQQARPNPFSLWFLQNFKNISKSKNIGYYDVLLTFPSLALLVSRRHLVKLNLKSGRMLKLNG